LAFTVSQHKTTQKNSI